MANIKFSEFTEQSDPANVEFVVGYNGSDNVRIDPANLGGTVAFLTPESQGTVNSVNDTPAAMLVYEFSVGSDGEIWTDANGESLVSVGDTLALQSLNGNYTTPTVTVSGTDGSEYIQYIGDLGSSSPLEAEGWNIYNGDDLNAIINLSSVLSFVTTSGVLYVTESGVNFTGNGTNTVNVGLNVNDKVYLNSIPLVDGGQNLYNPITGAVSLGLTDLDDVGADGTNGQVLTTDGSGSFTFADAGGGGGASSLNDLTDVLIDGTSSYFINIPASLTGNPVDNVVIGDGAGSSLLNGRSNTLIGHDAGNNLSTRSYNTCIGYQSGNNFNGNFNTVIGGNAGLTGSASAANAVSVGYQAGLASYATLVGYRTGSSANGVYATFVGYEVARTNQGAFNVGIGYRAGENNDTGANNVYIGKQAGKANTSGAQKTCVGDTAGSTSTGSNVTLIGYNSQPSAVSVNNEITLGDSNVSTLRCAVTTITSLSDERDKSEIKDLEYGLDFINSLQPREFVWDNRAEIKKQDVLDENGEPSLDDDGNVVTKDVEFYSANKGKKDFGFIAQEVKELDNDTLRLVYSENVEKLEMSYGKLVPILVKAMQELKAEIELLKA